MHSLSVLVQCLRVNDLKREWWLDLPELTSIQLGDYAFQFKNDDESTELIMRSGDDEMKWWIDLPKLTSLTAEGEYSCTFRCPRSITLEGISYHSILTNRHALSHRCHSWKGICLHREENRSYQESHFLLSLTPRHYSRSTRVSPVHCFFQTLFLITSMFITSNSHTSTVITNLHFLVMQHMRTRPTCTWIHLQPLGHFNPQQSSLHCHLERAYFMRLIE